MKRNLPYVINIRIIFKKLLFKKFNIFKKAT